MGDVARTVPALASLRAAFPEARIDWLVQNGFEPVVGNHPALSNVITFPKKHLVAALKQLRLGPLRTFTRSLRETGYDMVFDLQGLARSGYLAWASGAPLRFGQANARELGWLGYNRRVHVSNDVHVVERMLRIVALAGVTPLHDMRLYTSDAHRAWAVATLGTPAPVVLAPTSAWASKQWPAERFVALAEAMLARGHRVAIIGGPGEEAKVRPLVELAGRRPEVLNLIGRTSVGQMMAAIQHAALLVGNDSAALHMAVGFSRPMVALLGATVVGRGGPFGRERDVIQHLQPGDVMSFKRPGAETLMERISVEEVIEACEARLTSPRPG
jgi:heptosyltransferase-1/heptosyltransferase-2